jgi:hypothetical protein
MRAISRLLLGTALACGVAACGVTTPSSLTLEPTFSGTVDRGATSSSHVAIFTAQKTGEFILTITSLTPDTGATLTAEYGTPTTDSSGNVFCVPITTAPAGLNRSAFDTTLPAGQYCVFFADPGITLPQTETFQATIKHS